MISKMQLAWQNIYTSNQKGKILKGIAVAMETEMVTLTKDGKKERKAIDSLIVNFKDIKILIPSSEIKEGKIDKRQMRNMIGSEIRFIIVEVDKLTNKAVASRKMALEKIRKIELKKYEKQDKVFARVISVFPKYIEIECLGVDIRLKPEDLEYGYIANLTKNYQVGDKIKVLIKEIDVDKGILKVSHKETKEDPYKIARKNYVEKGEYLGEVTGYSDNGVFVNLEQGIDTMATLPNWMEMPPTIGDKVVIKIIKIQEEKRKIYSSLLKVVRRETFE